MPPLQQSMVAGAMATITVLAWVSFECAFLKPFKVVLWNEYMGWVGMFAGLLFVNVTALSYIFMRAFGMRTTGQKLRHMDGSLRTGGSVMPDLSERLDRQ